jgi:hypothetical protein
MIRLHAVSPENELRVAQRLADSISLAWPEIAASTHDFVDVLVGIRTPTDVDILVIVDLAKPHEIAPHPRRMGGLSPAASVRQAFFAIEVKQLDRDCYNRIGNQLFPVYDGRQESRSVAAQARDAAHGLGQFARQRGFDPFVYSVAWLTDVHESDLRDIEPMVLGAEANWLDLLDVAAQQSIGALERPSPNMSVAVRIIRERFLTTRKESSRDRARVERLSRDLASRATVDELVQRAGKRQICLVGRGGSGKTTSLALLAARLAESGNRVLILTFHLTLRSDIAHLVASLSRKAAIPEDRIQVETMMSFVLSALGALGVAPPVNGTTIDYAALDGVLDETRLLLVGDAGDPDGDVEKLRTLQPERFAWDYVFVDEAQDCTNSERDVLRALYGHRRFVLADGVDQLVRRQVPCDWNEGIPSGERLVHYLDSSLRMLRNVAIFVNAFAQGLGFELWRIAPREELPGGRVLIVTGNPIGKPFLQAIKAAARGNKADLVDCLMCLPPKHGNDDRARLEFLAAAESAGVPTWDGTDAAVRASATAGLEALRLVRYDSCRGLEGWITVALDIDQFVESKERYPNLHPDDPVIAAQIVADRWTLIPLTRAVHTLVITIQDEQSRIAHVLREVTSDSSFPRGIVEWVSAEECAARMTPVAS